MSAPSTPMSLPTTNTSTNARLKIPVSRLEIPAKAKRRSPANSNCSEVVKAVKGIRARPRRNRVGSALLKNAIGVDTRYQPTVIAKTELAKTIARATEIACETEKRFEIRKY